ncbi:MAG: multidrug efflux SMR transporter [Planctomyces sp.]|nr:multidrug efflux SMR transporter [Planctomyces sp.]
MAWALLVLAGVFEVGWAVALKASDGFTRLWPSVATAGFMTASVLLLGVSMRTIPLGTAYAVWTGIGAVGAVLCGIALFHEPLTAARMACVVLILAGIVGLKLFHPAPPVA